MRGSGKSTIINVLMKYIEINKGNVLADNKDLSDLNIDNIMTNVVPDIAQRLKDKDNCQTLSGEE